MADARNSALVRALRKCQNQYGRQWGGYLLVVDALALIEAGAISPSRSKKDLETARQRGDGQPFWFYFNANEPLAVQLRAAAK